MSSKRDQDKSSPPAPALHGAGAAVLVVNGWMLLFHPRLIEQLERLRDAARAEGEKRPDHAPAGPNTKLLATVWDQLVREIPEDPLRPTYRQGNTLGPELRHWQRAKFGNGRFRLFFRYQSKARIIVFAWVNDSETLRTYGSRTDAYAVFRRMVESGNPPDDWDELIAAASSPDAVRRARRFLGSQGEDRPSA